MLVGVCIRPDSPHAETGAQHTIITITEAAENPYDDEEEAFPATATPQGSLLTLEQMMHLCAALATHAPTQPDTGVSSTDWDRRQSKKEHPEGGNTTEITTLHKTWNRNEAFVLNKLCNSSSSMHQANSAHSTNDECGR